MDEEKSHQTWVSEMDVILPGICGVPSPWGPVVCHEPSGHQGYHVVVTDDMIRRSLAAVDSLQALEAIAPQRILNLLDWAYSPNLLSSDEHWALAVNGQSRKPINTIKPTERYL